MKLFTDIIHFILLCMIIGSIRQTATLLREIISLLRNEGEMVYSVTNEEE